MKGAAYASDSGSGSGSGQVQVTNVGWMTRGVPGTVVGAHDQSVMVIEYGKPVGPVPEAVLSLPYK